MALDDKTVLDERDLPTHWYNIVPDVPSPPSSPLHPGAGPPPLAAHPHVSRPQASAGADTGRPKDHHRAHRRHLEQKLRELLLGQGDGVGHERTSVAFQVLG